MTAPLEPRDYLKLQIRLPKQGAFVLDDPIKGVLDRETLGGEAEPNNLFVLDQSRLDDQVLSLPGDDPNTEWTDVLSFAQPIHIQRGAKKTETGSELEVGLFTVTLIGPELDPHQNLSVVPGTPMRLMTTDDKPVFMGTIRRVNTVYGDDDKVRVTISVQDGVQSLGALMRYGADSADFATRIDSLLTKHNIAYNIRGTSTAQLAQTDYESNLVNHLQLATDSADGFFYLDRAGVVQVSGSKVIDDTYAWYESDRNYVTNPKGAGGITADVGWSGTNGTGGTSALSYQAVAGPVGTGYVRRTWSTATTVVSGGTYVGILGTATGAGVISVVAGEQITASVYVRTNKSQRMSMYLAYYKADGTICAANADAKNTGATGLQYVSLAGTWDRRSLTAIVPPDAVKVAIVNVAYAGTQDGVTGTVWAVNDYLDVTGGLVTRTPAAGDYFDGDTADQTTLRYTWTGVANQSQSISEYREMAVPGNDPYERTYRRNLFKNPAFRASSNFLSSFGDWVYWSPDGGRDGRGDVYAYFGSQVGDAIYGQSSVNTHFFTINTQEWNGTFEDNTLPVTPGKVMTFSAYMKTYRSDMPLYNWVEWRNGSTIVGHTPLANPVFCQNQTWIRVSTTATVPVGTTHAIYMMGPWQAYSNTDESPLPLLDWNAGDDMHISDILIEESATLNDWFDGDLIDDEANFYSWEDSPNASVSILTHAVAKTGVLSFYSKYVDDSKALYYKDIDYTYDTGGILNELKVSNRQWDAVGQKGLTVDEVFTDLTSQATWGPSSATLEVNLVDPVEVQDLAQTILIRNRAPVNTVNSLTWNATKNMDIAAGLEPYQVVRVHFENKYFEEIDYYMVLAVEHDISGDVWMTTLTLDHFEGGDLN